MKEKEKINGYLHSIMEKVDYIIEEGDLKLLTHYKSDYTYNFDGEKVMRAREIGITLISGGAGTGKLIWPFIDLNI